MALATTVCSSLGLILLAITCFILSSDNYVQANDNDAESLTKIGQGVGHIMNIYYWLVLNITFNYPT